ncbi:ParB N-terminal domain-containing protein [Streptomyces sp. NPDC059352]|uniref:ParB N-terminal domain-containing protein n=1 Tax=Streptomyces sp. NPDC059352 TaxID=3346810 RepID=UPI0036C02D38
MSLAKLFRLFQPVELLQTPGHTWETETAWLRQHHPRRMARIRGSVERHGILEPIRLCYGDPACGTDLHVVDGHHRAVIAQELGIKRVPVADAWDGSDWWLHVPDEQQEDPEEWAR